MLVKKHIHTHIVLLVDILSPLTTFDPMMPGICATSCSLRCSLQVSASGLASDRQRDLIRAGHNGFEPCPTSHIYLQGFMLCSYWIISAC